jgi:hypothetical protein
VAKSSGSLEAELARRCAGEQRAGQRSTPNPVYGGGRTRATMRYLAELSAHGAAPNRSLVQSKHAVPLRRPGCMRAIRFEGDGQQAWVDEKFELRYAKSVVTVPVPPDISILGGARWLVFFAWRCPAEPVGSI